MSSEALLDTVSKPENKMIRVAICGGGISGLCLAVALSRYPSIQIDLYEATGRFKEIGAGVMMWARPWEILQLLGLGTELSQVAHAPPDKSLGVGFDFRKSDQAEPGFQFHLVKVPYGCIRFHRAHFLDVFVDHVSPDVAHFSKRLTSFSNNGADGGVTLYFADGSTAICDVLVGCDGIKSTVRSQLLTEAATACSSTEDREDILKRIQPMWSGMMAYRGLILTDRIPKTSTGENHRTITNPMMYCGKSKHVVSYSISNGNIVNVVAMYSNSDEKYTLYNGPWVEDCSRDELLSCYDGWEPEVRSILQCVEKPTRWAIYHLRSLPFYVKNRVALIGDAAHAMTPHLGAGAGQAIEDAFVLATLLGHPSTTRSNVSSALAAYEQVRLPMATRVQRESFNSGKMYQFNSQFGDDFKKLGPAIERQWDWIWETTPDEDCQRAIALMEEMRESK